MHLAKVFALGAYVYQALIAFGLLIAAARILPPSQYAGYSIFIAVTQFGAIAFFEWIRFATTRFYPGRSPLGEARQRGTILVEALACAGLTIVAGLVAMAFGVPPLLALLGAGVSILQGASDLHLTMLRFRRRFTAFSWIQGLRASLLAIATIIGAITGGTVTAAAAGLLAGYLLYALVVAVADRRTRYTRGRLAADVARAHFTYGSVAAGASVLGLVAPLGLRLILANVMGAHAAAGALLALDLLQRPFVLVVAALQAIQYPDVVTAYDRSDKAGLPFRLGQYYVLLTTLTLIAAAGIVVLLKPVALIAVDTDLQAQFLIAAPFVVALATLRALTQNVSNTPAHLRRDLVQLIVLALVDCVLLNLLALAAAWIFGADSAAILGAATLGAVLAGVVGLRVLVSLPAELPMKPLFVAIAGLIVPVLLLLAPLSDPFVATAVGLLAAGVTSLVALWFLYRAMRPAMVSA
jgi:O-antigen/teichoic acid export membrane protein